MWCQSVHNLKMSKEKFEKVLRDLENNVRDRRWSDYSHQDELKRLTKRVEVAVKKLDSFQENLSSMIEEHFRMQNQQLKKFLKDNSHSIRSSNCSASVRKKKKKKYSFCDDESIFGKSSSSEDSLCTPSPKRKKDTIDLIDSDNDLEINLPISTLKHEQYVTPVKKESENDIVKVKKERIM